MHLHFYLPVYLPIILSVYYRSMYLSEQALGKLKQKKLKMEHLR
jgi:hypothetical protein